MRTRKGAGLDDGRSRREAPRRRRWLVGVTAAVAMLATVTVASDPAVARAGGSGADAGASSTPTVPLLTGGLLTVTGGETSTWSWDDGQGTGMNDSGSIDSLTTRYLFPIGYDGVPTLPASNFPDGQQPLTEAVTWQSTVGTESADVYGKDSNDQPYNYSCTWTVDGARPKALVGFPGRQAYAPVFSGLSVANPQCSDPSKPMQWSPFAAGGDAASLNVPTQPQHASSISNPVHIEKSPCPTGVWPNCAGDDNFDGTISLHCLLCVTDITFRQLEDPTTGDSTLTDVPSTGTYDGNEVQVDATVKNVSNVPINTPVYFADGDTNQWLIPDDPTNWNPLQEISFPANATTHVTFDWNTTGYSWQDGNPHSSRQVQVLTPLGGAYRGITVLPKPVVLVHGWNSSAVTWEKMKALLKAQNPDWRGYAVGDNPTWSAPMDTDPRSGVSIDANAFAMGKYIESLRAHTGAQHVDVVAHSMGGLISRDYIAKLMPQVPQPPGSRPVVSHLIMLGTPNLGSWCAVPLSTVLSHFDKATPTYQLRPDYVADVFDKTVTDQEGVPFSVEAGYGYGLDCDLTTRWNGDMVVPVPSAWWSYADVDKIIDMHTSLPSDPKILTNFIKPRLAVSPPTLGTPSGASTQKLGLRHVNRNPAVATDAVADQLAAVSDTKIAGHGRHTITVTVPKRTSQLSAVFIAPPAVAATLISPSGKNVATQAAGSPVAAQPARALVASKPAAGKWKVSLTNTASVAESVVLGADLTGRTVTLRPTAARDTKSRRLVITAQLLRSGRPLHGVTMTAQVRGTSKPFGTLRLYDDGKHHDGAANDGKYGVATRALPAAQYFVVVKAVRKSTVRLTSLLSS